MNEGSDKDERVKDGEEERGGSEKGGALKSTGTAVAPRRWENSRG